MAISEQKHQEGRRTRRRKRKRRRRGEGQEEELSLLSSGNWTEVAIAGQIIWAGNW